MTIKIRGCRLCTLGDCLCDQVTRWNDIQNIRTPDDFKPGYRRKYLINIHGVDPDDHTSADRYVEILHNWCLPADDPQRRYKGDGGYRRFVDDLANIKPKPMRW